MVGRTMIMRPNTALGKQVEVGKENKGISKAFTLLPPLNFE